MRLSLTAPDGSTNTYSYDALNRLSTLTNSLTGQFGFGYDALSRRTSLTRPNGVNTSYGYDSLSHLLSVLHQAGANTVDGASYTYDPAGNRATKTNHLNNVTEGYTYDPIYQLTQVMKGGSTSETYSYDAVGNRLSSLGVSSYTYNPSNELTSSSSGNYTYDNNGNTLTDASGKTFTWDFENRLTTAVVPGTGTVAFKYDPFGRRIQKSGPLGTTNYFYDGLDLIETVSGSGSESASYAQGVGIDEPLAELQGSTTDYYAVDGLGSITSLFNATGVLANTYTYDSFGKLTASTGTITNTLQYTAREFDSETGLSFYRARYYDPVTGRFISEDPLRFLSDINFYRYVFNSPVNFIDPLGLECTCTYHQSTGAIRCVDNQTGRVVADGTGYSGRGLGLNNPDMQNVEDTGPLPQGSYNLGPPTNEKGPLTIPLRPRPGTNLGGRTGGFLIHGDNNARNHSASHGCIIQERNIRRAIADCGGGTVNVEQ